METKIYLVKNISKFSEWTGIKILSEKTRGNFLCWWVHSRYKKHVRIIWARRLEKALLETDESGIALYIVVAFSRLLMHEIMAYKNVNYSSRYICFLWQLAMIRSATNQLLNNKRWVIDDNASTHSSIKVQKWLEKSNMRLITISPYYSSQNPIEKVIVAIKS